MIRSRYGTTDLLQYGPTAIRNYCTTAMPGPAGRSAENGLDLLLLAVRLVAGGVFSQMRATVLADSPVAEAMSRYGRPWPRRSKTVSYCSGLTAIGRPGRWPRFRAASSPAQVTTLMSRARMFSALVGTLHGVTSGRRPCRVSVGTLRAARESRNDGRGRVAPAPPVISSSVSSAATPLLPAPSLLGLTQPQYGCAEVQQRRRQCRHRHQRLCDLPTHPLPSSGRATLWADPDPRRARACRSGVSAAPRASPDRRGRH